jgi:hypothetical protein
LPLPNIDRKLAREMSRSCCHTVSGLPQNRHWPVPRSPPAARWTTLRRRTPAPRTRRTRPRRPQPCSDLPQVSDRDRWATQSDRSSERRSRTALPRCHPAIKPAWRISGRIDGTYRPRR